MKKLLRNKKGAEGIPWFTVLMIAAGIFLIVLSFMSGPIIGGFSKGTIAGLVEPKIDGCEVKGQRLEARGEINDYDGDGLPNDCDNCPFTPNWGEYVEDMDGDGFPVPIDPKKQKVWKEGDTEIRLCCGNNGVGGNNPDIIENWEKYCETEENDLEYGPKKLILSYVESKKS
jgi:hypothetical protein